MMKKHLYFGLTKKKGDAPNSSFLKLMPLKVPGFQSQFPLFFQNFFFQNKNYFCCFFFFSCMENLLTALLKMLSHGRLAFAAAAGCN